MAFTKNDEAVSTVIGTILMVAVTVILAAVIAMYVFGQRMLQKPKLSRQRLRWIKRGLF